MRKRLKQILAGFGVLVLVLFGALYFGGRWAVGQYLSQDLVIGNGKLRLVAARFRWSLDLRADSVLYTSPTLGIAGGRTVVSANLFRSLVHFSPSVTLDADTLLLRLVPGPDTATPPRDSIAFPDLRIPASVVVRAKRIAVLDTGGLMARLDGVQLETQGPQGVKLGIRSAIARQTGMLEQSLAATVAWSDSTQVRAHIAWGYAKDRIVLDAKFPKANLLRASGALQVHLASSQPYAQAFHLAPTALRVDGFDAQVNASMGKTLVMDATIDARVSGFPDSLPLKLGAQKLSVRFAFHDSAGTWSVKSNGEGGEEVDLRGSLFVTATDSLANPVWLAGHLGATAKGRLRGFRVVAGGIRQRADLDVIHLHGSRNNFQAQIATGDGSRISADLRLTESGIAKVAAGHKPDPMKSRKRPQKAVALLPNWNGTFSAHIAPAERWLTAFTDTHVVFQKLQVTGNIAAGQIAAVVEANGLRAYGLMADSLRLVNRYGTQGYVLEPSHWVWRKVDWTLSGNVALNQPGHPMAFHLQNPRLGKLDAAMPNSDKMELHLRDLAVGELPYNGLDTLKAHQPRLTGDFRWDKRTRDGSVDLKLDGRFKEEPLQARARADWNARTLTVNEVRASLSGNEIYASGKLDLHGRQFYELAKLQKEDVEEVSLGADRFDLAKALALVMAQPPIQSGVAVGRLTYRKDVGFSGTYQLENLHRDGLDETVVVKKLALMGRGDTLVAQVVTGSELEPLFRDSITLAITGVLTPIQTIALDARAEGGMLLDFRGTIKDFKDLQGRLGLHGDITLPGSSGALRGIKLRADLSLPFQDGMQGLRIQADTLSADYLVAGLDTQTISAPVKMQNGKIVVPQLMVQSKGSAEMRGHFEWDPATKRMSGLLSGNSLSAQFGPGDKIRLQDIQLELRGDSSVLDLKASVGSGSAEHIKAPMRALAIFSQMDVNYTMPLGKAASRAAHDNRLPFLRLKMVLDSSELRYRLRSMETLQNLFRRNRQNQSVKRSQNMQVQIDVETSGRGNSIETDILRMNYVGNVSMSGIYPYALVNGRVSSQKGELGLKGQSYSIRRMDLKWLNIPLEEGLVELQAEKRLARNCEAGTLDSCNITTHLTGELSNLQFSYDSDCQGASGAGVEVAALVYSVRRGCYSSAMTGGGSGLSYQQQALGLLEPLASSYLSDAAGKLSGHWISNVQVTGLGALAGSSKTVDTSTAKSSASGSPDAIAIELLSKEFWRTRLRVKSAYAPENTLSSNPWNYRVGLEWRPPVPGFIEDPIWRRRFENHVNVEAAIFTDPNPTQTLQNQDALKKRLGLNYNYDFWEIWWVKNHPAAFPAAAKSRREEVKNQDSANGGRTP
jgi:hypothetical protein